MSEEIHSLVQLMVCAAIKQEFQFLVGVLDLHALLGLVI